MSRNRKIIAWSGGVSLLIAILLVASILVRGMIITGRNQTANTTSGTPTTVVHLSQANLEVTKVGNTAFVRIDRRGSASDHAELILEIVQKVQIEQFPKASWRLLDVEIDATEIYTSGIFLFFEPIG